MKAKIKGYEIDCTVSEFKQLIGSPTEKNAEEKTNVTDVKSVVKQKRKKHKKGFVSLLWKRSEDATLNREYKKLKGTETTHNIAKKLKRSHLPNRTVAAIETRIYNKQIK